MSLGSRPLAAALRTSAAHAFVASVDAPVLTDHDEHHLRRVLRIRADQQVTVSDGRGSWMVCRLTTAGLEQLTPVVSEPEPQPSCVVSAIPKGDRVDGVVAKLTEVGITDIVLADMDRSVVRWTGERLERQRQRLTRVLTEAAMQSRRVWLPTLVVGESFADAAARPGAVVADPDGEQVVQTACIIVGPEGGFSDRELGIGLARLCLADHVLRVETAAVVAAVRVRGF